MVADITHGVEVKAVAPSGHEYARMCALERVKVRQVEEFRIQRSMPSRLNGVGEMKYSGTALV